MPPSEPFVEIFVSKSPTPAELLPQQAPRRLQDPLVQRRSLLTFTGGAGQAQNMIEAHKALLPDIPRTSMDAVPHHSKLLLSLSDIR